MIVCIDSGNSRIKWGLYEHDAWRERASVAHGELSQLTALVERTPPPRRVMLANVAGETALLALLHALTPWAAVIHEVRSTAAAGGVVNGYANPASLGVDRWCALIGAHGLHAGPCVVVMAGTATTIDTLDADGRFRGGLILPGLELMRRSLARDTAGLPLAAGEYAAYPRRTDDAITTGCLEAQAGAIERAVARSGAGTVCLLSGGAAVAIGEHLGIACRHVDNLVLDGLLCLALEAAARQPG